MADTYKKPKMKASGKRIKQARVAPKIETLKTQDPEAIRSEMMSTKAGSILGVATAPMFFPISGPIYVVSRAQGMSREDASDRAFRTAWKVSGAIITFFPFPITPVIRGIGIAMLTLNKPVENLSKTDLNKLKIFAGEVAKNPELQQHLTETGAQLALMAATGQEMNEAQLTSMAINTASKVANTTQNQAISKGHISVQDAANIKQMANVVQQVATTTNEQAAQKKLSQLPPPAAAQLE